MSRTTDKNNLIELIPSHIIPLKKFLADIDGLLENRREDPINLLLSNGQIKFKLVTFVVFT